MTELAVAPLYLNWSFWAVVVSLLAIALSQLPPIHVLLRPKSLQTEVHNRAHLTHKVGNPNIGMFIKITNTGGRTVRVQRLNILLLRGSKLIANIPVKAYVPLQEKPSPVIFLPFALKPEEEWAYRVNFYNDFERSTDISFRKSASALMGEIGRLLGERAENDKDAVRTAEAFVEPFNTIFNQLFIWEPGEYTLRLIIETSPHVPQSGKEYRFTIYESDTEMLKKEIEDYPTGCGITFNNYDRHPGLSIELS